MKYFEEFVSNTTAGSGNQMICHGNGEVKTGRIFYKVNKGGKYEYSFLYTNIADSTYSDGTVSCCNMLCDSWKIYEMSVYICDECYENEMVELNNPISVTFNGKRQKEVAVGEFFCTDPVMLDLKDGAYICVQISFSASTFFYHEESLLPTFVLNNGRWEKDKRMPFASMIGCKRNVRAKIGFLGDSITQGIGTDINSYTHWNCKVAQILGNEYAFWNLGLGFGRAQDAASNGAWLFKAKQNDLIVLCFGVNDILQNRREEEIKNDLFKIVDILTKSGVKVFIQTIPPFDYETKKIQLWENVNEYIKTSILPLCVGMFDTSSVLSGNEKHMAKYGAHPDSQGCTVWAEKLCPILKQIAEKISK